MTERELESIPDVADWKVITDSVRVYIESETIAHNMRDYDDAWLEVTGNMLLDEKLKIAQFVADKLNRPAASAAPAQEPVGQVLSESEMGIGYDRRMGDVIWWNKPKGPAMLYATPVASAAPVVPETADCGMCGCTILCRPHPITNPP